MINFGEEHLMHSKSDNVEIMINNEENEVIKELFQSSLSGYQSSLETTKGSSFIFDHVNLLYCRCHKMNPNYGG